MTTARRAPIPADARQNPVDIAARAAFDRQYGSPDLGPLAIVVPAYREAASIATVVRSIPTTVLGLRVAILVVVDGPDEDTARAATAAGAYVSMPSVNRGQGAALNLGYVLAAGHGAEFLVTIDADGQYDPGEIPTLLEPILHGRADFVSGSRRLGANHQQDRIRQLGVVVYAALISILTRHHVTDPSFGLRAMRADVPAAIELDQPQYQAAELLIGAIMRGFRVTERPATMRRRTGGRSKKGSNLAYGYQFGRVVISTWCRERGRRCS
ncbi:MAG TPA: glycosyltransferase family 2 protein [Acidimicrobiia bacterium]